MLVWVEQNRTSMGGGTPSYLSPEQLKFLTDGMTIGQAAIKWLLAEPLVTTVLPNIYRDDQMEEFVAATDKPDLTTEQLARVAELYDRNFDLVPS